MSTSPPTVSASGSNTSLDIVKHFNDKFTAYDPSAKAGTLKRGPLPKKDCEFIACKVDRYNAGWFSSCSNFFYRLWQAVKPIFGKSDWQKMEALMRDKLLYHKFHLIPAKLVDTQKQTEAENAIRKGIRPHAKAHLQALALACKDGSNVKDKHFKDSNYHNTNKVPLIFHGDSGDLSHVPMVTKPVALSIRAALNAMGVTSKDPLKAITVGTDRQHVSVL